MRRTYRRSTSEKPSLSPTLAAHPPERDERPLFHESLHPHSPENKFIRDHTRRDALVFVKFLFLDIVAFPGAYLQPVTQTATRRLRNKGCSAGNRLKWSFTTFCGSSARPWPSSAVPRSLLARMRPMGIKVKRVFVGICAFDTALLYYLCIYCCFVFFFGKIDRLSIYILSIRNQLCIGKSIFSIR